MDHMTASCNLCVKVGTFDQLEQRKITVSDVTIIGNEMLTVQHDLIFSIYSM